MVGTGWHSAGMASRVRKYVRRDPPQVVLVLWDGEWVKANLTSWVLPEGGEWLASVRWWGHIATVTAERVKPHPDFPYERDLAEHRELQARRAAEKAGRPANDGTPPLDR